MPARLVQVTIYNNSDYPIVWQDDGRSHGFWQEPWYPSNIKSLQKGEQASFRLESGGILTGVEGWALFKVDIPFAANEEPTVEFFQLNFNRPYLETMPFDGKIEYSRRDPRTHDAEHAGPQLAYLFDYHSHDLDDYTFNAIEFASLLPAPIYFFGVGLVEGVPALLNESFAKHVWWIVEVRNTGVGGRETLPLRLAATKNIIYAVTPRVERLVTRAETSPHASGGDLIWYRHDGRLDGSLKWEGPDRVGKRWDGFKQLFSGGEGVLYGVTPRVGATVASQTAATLESGGHIGLTPASGGDLLWYRHVGREDGTFKWEGPKRVGFGWHAFKHLFSGGDGIIYAIQENGDLMWYRHIGYSDGSFVWQGPQRVGTGWGDLTQVFYGGNGIIYAVTPKVPATFHVTGGVSPASGGDLMWYHHLGREDGSFNWNGPRRVGTGWDGFERVFSDGEGIIYGVPPKVEASFSSETVLISSLESADHIQASFTPASGGELMWYKHLGWKEGTFEWEGPKQVGTGWAGLEQLFSGGVSAT